MADKPTEAPKLYPAIMHPWNLEPHRSRHLAAMTAEGLHDKADIADQLALRDKLIAGREEQIKAAERRGRILGIRDYEIELMKAEVSGQPVQRRDIIEKLHAKLARVCTVHTYDPVGICVDCGFNGRTQVEKSNV